MKDSFSYFPISPCADMQCNTVRSTGLSSDVIY